MFKGFMCHITNAPVTPAECLACSLAGGLQDAGSGQWCPFTPPIVRGLTASNAPRGLLAYSVTELLGCPRKIVLREQVDFWIKPSQAYWAFRGKLAHAIVELGHQDPGVVLEERYYADLDGMMITGQVDLLYTARRHLVDYKTTKQAPQDLKRYVCPACGSVLRETPWAYKKGSSVTCQTCGAVHNANDLQAQSVPPRPYAGHVQQLNIYRWLLAQNHIPVDSAEIVYLDMSAALRLPIPLWPLADTETLLRERLAALQTCGADGLPAGVQDDAEENWQCRFCPLVAECAVYADMAAQDQLLVAAAVDTADGAAAASVDATNLPGDGDIIDY